MGARAVSWQQMGVGPLMWANVGSKHSIMYIALIICNVRDVFINFAGNVMSFLRKKKYPPGMVKDLKKTEDVAEVRYCIVDGYCLLLQLLLLL